LLLGLVEKSLFLDAEELGLDPAELGLDPAERGLDSAELGLDPAELGLDPAERVLDPAERALDLAERERADAAQYVPFVSFPPTCLRSRMPSPSAQFAALGLALPTPPKAVAAYVPFVRSGNLVFVSGQLPFVSGKLLAVGPVPSQTSVEDAKAAARQCGLNALAILADALGVADPTSLDRVKRIVKLGVFVCSDVGFTQQPQVANGASELMEQIFGEAGKHARAAVGNIALPLGASVEVELIAEV
jgi:enamine deaminase RidA (YjgF/YER057c/UK114 family)